jgi:hypothetical protein
MVERTGEVPFTVLCTERSQSQLELWQGPLMALDSPSEIPWTSGASRRSALSSARHCKLTVVSCAL